MKHSLRTALTELGLAGLVILACCTYDWKSPPDATQDAGQEAGVDGVGRDDAAFDAGPRPDTGALPDATTPPDAAAESDAAVQPDAKPDPGEPCEQADCGTCGTSCTAGQVCEMGRCTNKCGDGQLDLGLGEQCDPGRDVYGCTACDITGPYGSTCSNVGEVTADGVCYNFGTGMGASPPMVLPQSFGDGSCPSVPGASWATIEIVAGLCALACETAADCPPDYVCHGALHCWKF